MTLTNLVFICTKETPYTPGMPGIILHKDAYEIGEQKYSDYGGDIGTKKCPNCSYTWKEELPE